MNLTPSNIKTSELTFTVDPDKQYCILQLKKGSYIVGKIYFYLFAFDIFEEAYNKLSDSQKNYVSTILIFSVVSQDFEKRLAYYEISSEDEEITDCLGCLDSQIHPLYSPYYGG